MVAIDEWICKCKSYMDKKMVHLLVICSLIKFEVSISSTKLNYIIPILGVRFCFKIFILLARLSAAFDIKGL